MKRIRCLFCCSVLMITVGCASTKPPSGAIVGHTQGMWVSPGQTLVQIKTTQPVDNLFVNGERCSYDGVLYFAEVPVLCEKTPVVVTTILANGDVVVLDRMALRADGGTPAACPRVERPIVITYPPGGAIFGRSKEWE